MWLEAADSTDFDHSGDYTVGGWFKVDNTTGFKVIQAKWRVNGTNQEFLIRTNGTNLDAFVWGTSQHQLTHTAGVTANKWYFYVLTVNSTSNSISLALGDEDGTALASEASDISSQTANQGIGVYSIGRTDPIDADATRIAGDIDHTWFYNAIMSADEVTWMYNSGAGIDWETIEDSSDTDNPGTTNFAAFHEYNERHLARTDFANNNTLAPGSTGDPTLVAGHVEKKPRLEDRGAVFVRDDANNGDWFDATVSDLLGTDPDGAINFWFKTTYSTTAQVFWALTEDTATDNQFYMSLGTDGSVSFAHITSGVTIVANGTTSTGLDDGKWHNVHLQSNGTAYFMYVDNTLQSLSFSQGTNDGSWFGDLDSGINKLRIGGRRANSVNDFPYNGSLDNVMFLNATFSGADVNGKFYRNGAGRALEDIAGEDATMWTQTHHAWPLSINSIDDGFGADLKGTVVLTNVGATDDDGIAAGQAKGPQVSRLVDLVNTNHLTQDTFTKRTDFKRFSQAVPSQGLLFDGVDDFYAITAFGEGAQTVPNVYCLAVFIPVPADATIRTFQDDTGANSNAVIGKNAANNRTVDVGTVTTFNAAVAAFEVWYVIQDDAGGGSKTYVNGGTAITTSNLGTNSLTGLTLGALKGGASGFLSGWIMARAHLNQVPSNTWLNWLGQTWHTEFVGNTTNWTDI
jgi:hypothetical protein